MTVNSGGEKIFVEEVERAIAGHPAVADVVVVGRPSERWGQEVVAVVQLAEGATTTSESVVEEASAHIARYKLPKDVVFVDVIQRSPSGKADYRWAAETAVKAATAGDDGAVATDLGSGDRGIGARRVVTARLVLRPFTDVDRAPFFELNTHPLVVESLGSSPTRAESDAMVDRYSEEMAREGWGFWAVEVAGGAPFVGMVGLHRVTPALPLRAGGRGRLAAASRSLGPRLCHRGGGGSLDFGFDEAGLDEIVAFTTTVNTRSQAVMERIGMTRDADGDFDHPALPEGSPLRRHVLYRISAPSSSSQVAPSVAP